MQASCQSASRLRDRQVIKRLTGETQRSVRVIIWTCVSQWSFRDSVSEGVQVQSTIDDPILLFRRHRMVCRSLSD